MASHAGWLYVIKTKNGFIDTNGKETQDINKARLIRCLEFGFSDPSRAYERMGFKDKGINKDELKYFTLEPSYESRVGEIEDYLVEMDYDFVTSRNISYNTFNNYRLYNYEKYRTYINGLIKKVSDYYSDKEVDEVINLNDQIKHLHQVKKYSCKETEYEVQKFYYEDGEIFKYSFNLKDLHIENYFNLDNDSVNYYNNLLNNGIEDYLIKKLNKYIDVFDIYKEIDIKLMENNNGILNIYFSKCDYYLLDYLNNCIREFYDQNGIHITRMFGSYILLKKVGGKLTAIKATPIPIKYCPLMIKLLKEVAGEYVDELIKTLETNDLVLQEKYMCKLINETVIKSGYFDTNRPLNSCEANVLFGASETMSSAFKNNLIDAAVIVSNNLGTIITTNEFNTQGAVRRMTGLFHTSPNETIINTAKRERIVPVYPYTATINQLEGVKKAISLGYKRIAVSVAANDNYLHKELKELEKEGIKIYKFGLCSTGIDKETAIIMKDNADVVWSCASKYVKEIIESNAIAQVGIKIPVHIMSKEGWEIIKNHLIEMNDSLNVNDVELQVGEGKPVFLNQKGDIKVLQKKHIKKCNDCPYPCI